jgi:hypothetical protein
MNNNNEYAQRANQNRRERLVNKISQKANQKSVIDRLEGWIQAMGILLIILTLWSILTEAAFLYPQLKNTTQSTWIAAPVTIMIVAAIETLKILGGTTLIRMKAFNWLQDGSYYKVMFGILLIPVAVAYLASAFCTIKGAPLTVDHINRQTTTLPLVDLQEIRSSYDAKIAQQNEVIDQGKQMTWKGKVVSDGRKLIRQANETIEKLNDDLEAELAAARAKNSELVAGNQADVANVGNWLQGFGGISELLTLLLLVFKIHYERAAADEHDGNNTPPTGGSGKGKSLDPKSILDELGLNGLSLDELKSLSEQSRTGASPPKPPHKSRQKVRDNRVIEHIGENGEIKLYKYSDVEGFISKYEQRVAKAAQAIQSGKADQKIKDAYSNNSQWLSYWNGRLSEFNNLHNLPSA